MNTEYEMEPHRWTGKKFGWSVCQTCGLIALRNEFSFWASAKGCNNEDHPRYKHMRSIAGRRWKA